MSNLVGTGLNQVPTNGMLGGLAYQSPYSASIKDLDLRDLSKIKSEIGDTAVDVFVYDTSKDSDGGAWRKRTQHTSWYNETLNTATRGSRREFPSVAVVVAEDSTYTIYDGDDPDLPMWMVFQANSTSGARIARAGTSAITMLNGLMGAPRNVSSRSAGFADFLSDTAYEIGSNGKYSTIGGWNGLVNRNTTGDWTNVDANYAILSPTINDIAMKVLPNAPIDDATGIHIPTIAFATDAGTSIVNNNGTVANIDRGGSAEFTGSIAFDEDNHIIISWGTGSGGYRHISRITDINTSTSSGDGYTNDYFTAYIEGAGNSAAGDVTGVITIDNTGRNFAVDYADTTGRDDNTDDRLVRVVPLNDANATSQNLVSFATTSYNTGWMHGNIKGAFLSDTSTTNVTGSELITNPGPNFSNTSGWGATNGSLSISSGDLLLTGSNTVNEHMYSTGFTLTSGKTYVLSIDSNQLFTYTRIGTTIDLSTAEQLDTSAASGLNSYTFTATASGTFYLKLGMVTSYVTGSINSVSLRLAEEDRSLNNNGLQVNGTITKSAVATGADLVAYSGWSNTNYLSQPYNADMNFGTDDFCVMGWINTSSFPGTTSVIVSQHNGVDNSGNRWSLYILSSGLLGFFQTDGSSDTNTVNGPQTTAGVWQHVAAVRRGSANQIVFYLNGERLARTGTSRDVDNTGNMTTVGVDHSFGSAATNTSISLLRITKTEPTEEQIKKIYEDEKHLFQENAKCTLYGSSDLPTALAYDEDEETLYVGTSSGRSDFRGLRRINNTTTAVTTAISASNGLVAEE